VILYVCEDPLTLLEPGILSLVEYIMIARSSYSQNHPKMGSASPTLENYHTVWEGVSPQQVAHLPVAVWNMLLFYYTT